MRSGRPRDPGAARPNRVQRRLRSYRLLNLRLRSNEPCAHPDQPGRRLSTSTWSTPFAPSGAWRTPRTTRASASRPARRASASPRGAFRDRDAKRVPLVRRRDRRRAVENPRARSCARAREPLCSLSPTSGKSSDERKLWKSALLDAAPTAGSEAASFCALPPLRHGCLLRSSAFRAREPRWGSGLPQAA